MQQCLRRGAGGHPSPPDGLLLCTHWEAAPQSLEYGWGGGAGQVRPGPPSAGPQQPGASHLGLCCGLRGRSCRSLNLGKHPPGGACRQPTQGRLIPAASAHTAGREGGEHVRRGCSSSLGRSRAELPRLPSVSGTNTFSCSEGIKRKFWKVCHQFALFQ